MKVQIKQRQGYRRFLMISVGMMILLALIIVWQVNGLMKKTEMALNNITFETVEVAQLKNGTYEGSWDSISVKATVQVTVTEGKVQTIKILEHQNGRGQKGEAITDAVLKAQSISVDSITGATGSSKTILKAIEQALLKAK